MKTEGVLNYTGNKSKLIPMLNELFDKSGCDRLVDCCAGGLSVTLHSNFNTVLSNDLNTPLVKLYTRMGKCNMCDVINAVTDASVGFRLSKTNKMGYLGLRDVYNTEIKNGLEPDPLFLYVLHCYSFSNMIRFNKEGLFNSPFGEREFNKNSMDKLKNFYDIMKYKTIEFSNESFADLVIKDNDLVYIDPPYLITEAVYNKGWTGETDKIMMDWLDTLHERGVKFVMSNVTHHRGKINQNLIDWSMKYNVHSKDHKYVSNAYQYKKCR